MKSEKTNKHFAWKKGLALKQKEGLKFIWQQSGQISAKLVEQLPTCSLKRTYNSAKFDFREKRENVFFAASCQ